ncbi:MAG: gamma-glutamylcyclotransferase [Cyanobacteria bacterium REEB417]|nr:gamma-glutamylcyclotransferase [Cyanobacteria bacterium REEB417]
MSARSERLFVYGTLKRGEPNHHLLQSCPYQGEAVMPGLLLYDLGPFPMAVAGEGEVRGELYALRRAELRGTDRLEGYPRLYDRWLRALADGRQAWVYVGRAHQVRHSPLLSDGIWRGRANPEGRPR